MKTKDQSEYKTFDRLTRGLLGVPHSEVKAKLTEEKDAKKKKKDKKVQP